MRLVLDTNVLLYYIRDNVTAEFLERSYGLLGDPTNEPIISIVTVAEIQVLAYRNRWGKDKIATLDRLLKRLPIIDVRYQNLVDAYIDIELYSLNIHPARKREGSAIKMGKNDIWIAATAHITNAHLVSSDSDFKHLDGSYLELIEYERQLR